MKPLRIRRRSHAAAAAALLGGLAWVAGAARADSAQASGAGAAAPASTSMKGMDMPMPGMAASPGPSGSMSGMDMPGMDMSAMKMPGMKMPGTAAPAPENQGVPERSPVDLDQEQRQFIGVRTVPVALGDAVMTLRTVGIVAYDETRWVDVNTRIMGWAEKLYVDKPGQFVKAGDPMLDIYSPELYSAEYEYLLAYRQWSRFRRLAPPDGSTAGDAVWQDSAQEAKSLLESARKRLDLWEIPDSEVAALEKSGKPRDTLRLRAPSTGYVIVKAIDPSAMIRAGMMLYRVADLGSVWINADLYEYEMPYVKVGQKVEVTAIAHPGRVFDARVDFIYPYSENRTRTTTARLVMDNREGLFKPNDYVNAEIRIDQGRRLLVPQTALYDTGVSRYVFVEEGEGHFVPRLVGLGPTVGDGEVVVTRGLSEGEKVVVDGNFLLDSESQLRASAAGAH